MLKLHFVDPADQPKPKKQIYRLTNCSAYNQALIQRGRLTLWLDQHTTTDWYHTGPNKLRRLYWYSDACNQSALKLKSMFKLAFRQTQDLLQSLIEAMKLWLVCYLQLCRRQARLTCGIKPPHFPSERKQGMQSVVDSTGLKVYGEGEWKVRKHGVSKHRTWRKRHLAQDVATGELEAVELTTNRPLMPKWLSRC